MAQHTYITEANASNRTNFGRNVLALIKHFGIAQIIFQRTLRVSCGAIRGWSEGTIIATEKKANKIAKYFGYANYLPLLVEPADLVFPKNFAPAKANRNSVAPRTCIRCDDIFRSRNAAHRICKYCRYSEQNIAKKAMARAAREDWANS